MFEATYSVEDQTVDWLALADQLFPAEALVTTRPAFGSRVAP
ncbi:hypothetical protein [Mycobacterium sp. 852002-51152_SCH6134967]|nr:hypothetical protein [Mycobacterium sp. 852002-51152_SCH6134967]